MRVVRVLVLGLAVACLSSRADAKPAAIDPAKLVGVWEVVKSGMSPAGSTMEYKKDGNFASVIKGTENVFEGKYTVSGDVVTIDPPGFTMTIKELTANKLVLVGLGDTIEYKRKGAVAAGGGARPKTSPRMGGSNPGVQPRAGGSGKWQDINSKEGGFSVKMTSPANGDEHQEGGGFEVHTLTWSLQHMELLVMAVRGPTEIPDEERVKTLRQLLGKATSSMGSGYKIVSEEPARVAGTEGRRFVLTIDKPSGSVEGRGRALLKGKTAYLLLAVSGSKDKKLPDDADVFLDSLALTDTTEAAKAKPRSRETKAIANTIKAWGDPVDPDGDVSFEPAGRTLTIKVPGTAHVLAGDGDKFNAPRVLAPVRGDFVASVQVDGNFSPGRDSTSDKISSRQTGGLLLWKDKDHYLVLQRRSTVGRDGKLNRQVILDEHDDRKGDSHTQPVPEGSVILRLERKKGQLTGSFSTDGREFKPFKPLDVDWLDGPLQVGVVVFNTSTELHSVRFENYSVKTR